MTTTAITIFEPQNFGEIIKAAPQAYNENSVSHDRCIQCGQQLLQRADAEGMSDALDQEIAVFIDRARKTVRKMNANRSAVTQLFDAVRSAYTSLENEVDPAKKGTVPALLQERRNSYAAMKREQYEAEQRRRQLEQARSAARSRYAADVENDLLRQFDAFVASQCNRLDALDRSITLDNFDTVAAEIRDTSGQLPQQWYDGLRPQVMPPAILSPDEASAAAAEVTKRLHQRLAAQYAFEVSSTRDDILDRLPSKRKELELIAQASACEAERIKAQVEQRERMEAERRERERAERVAKEKAAAELAAQRLEMDGLFGAAEVQTVQYQPRTQVRKRISILNPEGFMQVVGMWWAQCGCTLSVAELEKVFSRQLTFCNRLANDKQHAIFIQSEHIEYIDDVKAK